MSQDYGAPRESLRAGFGQCKDGGRASGPGGDCCENVDGFVASLLCEGTCQLCCVTCSLPPIVRAGVGFFPTTGEQPAFPVEYPTVVPDDDGLSFTRSAYGLGLPIVFGADLLDANVFWHDGFEKKTFVEEGETKFYYTTSFAVGICEGVINRILRLYIGDRLVINNVATVDENGILQPGPSGNISGYTIDLTDQDGPLRNLTASDRQTKITVFNGDADQLPYGVMVDVEGYEFSPGYRGVAYILFENLLVMDAVPDIRVEVTSNTIDVYPRLYGELPGPVIEGFNAGWLAYDPSYDVFYVGGDPSVGSEDGVAIFDGTTLEAIQESLIVGGPNTTIDTWDPISTHILTNGMLLVDSGNASGDWRTFQPFAAVEVDARTGGALSGHNANGLNKATAGGVTFRAISPGSGLLTDVFCGSGPNAASRNSIGFMEITPEGQIVYRGGFQNSFAQGNDDLILAYYPVAKNISDANPTFPDGASTQGQHVYVFSHDGDETTLFVDRVTITAPYSVAAPNFVNAAGSIAYADFGGEGFVYHFRQVLSCHTDGTIIFFLQADDPDRKDVIFKYSPITNTVIWKTNPPSKFTVFRRNDCEHALIYGNTYAWLDSNTTGTGGSIFKLDLTTGGVTTVIESLDAQDLPEMWENHDYYNGIEDSITYLSEATGKDIVKVFLSRVTRAQAKVSDIVTNLLERVGWDRDETVVDDLTVLALDGYTIRNPMQLRSVFAELKQVFRFDVIESNGKIVYKTRGALPTKTIYEKDLGDANGGGWLQEDHEYDFADNRKLNLTYRDLDRDYRDNVQSILLPKYTNLAVDNDAAIDVQAPIVLTAETARKLAEILLYSKIIYEASYEGELPPKEIVLDPADVVTFEFKDATPSITLRMQDVTIGQDNSVRFIASKEDPDVYNDQVNLFGNIGRYDASEFETVPRRVDPLLMKIPYRTVAEAQAHDARGLYPVYLTLLNTRTNVSPQGLISMAVNDQPAEEVPQFTNFPTWGVVSVPLSERSDIFATDYVSQLTIKLQSATGATLGSAASTLDLLNNRSMNLAYVGDELIQFETVTDLGDNTYRLTGIHRGLHGTEVRSNTHKAGEAFVLLGGNTGVLDTGSVRVFYTPVADGPSKLVQTRVVSGNPFQYDQITDYQPTAFRPWAPNSGLINYVSTDAVISWQRRARYDFDWADDGSEGTAPFYDGDAPEYTFYLLKDPNLFSAGDPATYLRKITQNADTYTYTAAEQTVDGFDNLVDTLYVLVNHTGSLTGVEVGQGHVFLRGPRTP